MTPSDAILVINRGSTTTTGGFADSQFRAADESGNAVVDETRAIPDHAQALRRLLDLLSRHPAGASVIAVGHRVVHGGSDCDCPLPVDEALLARLARGSLWRPCGPAADGRAGNGSRAAVQCPRHICARAMSTLR